MATTYVSAGVYIQEKDDSLYTPAASPTIVGIVGTATKGPLNDPVFITNEGQLIDTFGRPRTKDRGMQAAIEILKACRTMYFVRIAGAAATYGSITANDTGSVATPATIGPSSNTETFNLAPNATIVLDINGAGDDTFTFLATAAARECATAENYNFAAIDVVAVTMGFKIDGGAEQTITFAAADPLIVNFAAVTAEEVADVINAQIVGASAAATTAGTKVTVTSDVKGLDSKVQAVNALTDNANAALGFVTSVASGTGNVGNIDAVEASEIETLLEAYWTPDIAVTVGSTGTVSISTVATGVAATLNLKSTSTAIGAAPLINLAPLDALVTGTASGAAAPTLTFRAATYGSWSSDIDVLVEASTALTGTVKVTVKYRDIVVETYDKLYKTGGGVIAGGYEIINAINNGTTDGAYGASEYIVAVEADITKGNPAAGTYTLTAGNNGDNWTAGTVVGTVSGTTATGMQCFANPEKIDVSILATPGISWASVISAGITICAARADCLFVADCPYGLSVSDVVAWHNGDSSVTVTVDQESRTQTNSTLFNSSYAALYYPFVQLFDKYNDEDIWVPPSSVVIRSMVYTDEAADPWWAPAGPNRSQTSSVLDIEYSPTLGERDLMMTPGNAVNPIAVIAGVGVTIMGQKTLQRAPTALDRVNVRRLLLYLEKAVARSVKYLMFEQNDSIMWRRFINLISPLFEDVKARRGLYDYRVVADESTTTSYMIDNNTFVGKIFLKPTKTAEILIVSFNLVPTGANFEEYVQA